jgi:hypothetical protein
MEPTEFDVEVCILENIRDCLNRRFAGGWSPLGGPVLLPEGGLLLTFIKHNRNFYSRSDILREPKNEQD